MRTARPIEIEVVDNLLEIETTLAVVTKLANTVRFYQDEEGEWCWQVALASGDTFGAPLCLETSVSAVVSCVLDGITRAVCQGRVRRTIP